MADRMIRFLICIMVFICVACTDRTPSLRIGAELVISDSLFLLQDKSVGLITNHTSMINGRHLADYLHEDEQVNLTALFAPEHGIRGIADAGAQIDDETDPGTGLPVFSLHGETYKPTPEMLKGIDILVFDMQDVGTRFYTYISTMGLAMQAAAEADILFMILDRPNPIGGLMVEGFTLEPENASFIGMYEIPATHGMTIGEIAQMLKGIPLTSGLENLELNVIPVSGWNREMLWSETGLSWIPPSPNIPNFETAVIYPGACFFGSTSASEGRGTLNPFVLIGAPWAEGETLAEKLNEYELPGLHFEPSAFTPRSIEGMSTSPKHLGRPVKGIRYVVREPENVRPVEAGVYLLHTFYHHAPDAIKKDFFRVQPMLDVSGTDKMYRMIEKGYAPEEIVDAWKQDVDSFYELRKPFLIY